MKKESFSFDTIFVQMELATCKIRFCAK